MIPVIITITLVILLIAKEVAGTSKHESVQRIARFLTVATIPLLALFLFMVTLVVIEIWF